MEVGCIRPSWGWDGHQAVAEVHKHIHEVPAAQGKLVGVTPAKEEAVVTVASLEVMAHQQLGMSAFGWSLHGGLCEWLLNFA